jgi:hypothetical protein
MRHWRDERAMLEIAVFHCRKGSECYRQVKRRRGRFPSAERTEVHPLRQTTLTNNLGLNERMQALQKGSSSCLKKYCRLGPVLSI